MPWWTFITFIPRSRVEFKVFAVENVLLFREKRTDQLTAVQSGGTVVLATEMEVLREEHLSLDFH